MEKMYGLAVISGVCLLVILIGILKKNAEILLNFAARVVVCFICTHFLNAFFAGHGLNVAIGVNLISVLTYGTLGFSGMAALYGIMLLQVL
ncbi:pro-sigmaK processing inhibitor BofA family protein [uncultured Eubacterium sp.]|uniref:pro-sigmaK processing inhibitor BofA family protein n=1 Tax=uncultured Eubacterium sp. TaxID=165185 RepID=UPI0025EAA0EE|nr:pro-sigmaK processing inhibitor BofA family protein [uncultured Eubacterium sp.]